MIGLGTFVHPLACLDDSCLVGERVRIYQFSSVIRGACIGDETVIAAGACVDGTIVGKRCIVSPGVDMGPGFEIGDDVFLGPHVVLCNDYWPRTHKSGFDYDALRRGDVVCIRISNGASIGAGAKIMPGLTIGEGAMIAANSVVTGDVPANCIWRHGGEIRAIRDEDRIVRVRPC